MEVTDIDDFPPSCPMKRTVVIPGISNAYLDMILHSKMLDRDAL